MESIFTDMIFTVDLFFAEDLILQTYFAAAITTSLLLLLVIAPRRRIIVHMVF